MHGPVSLPRLLYSIWPLHNQTQIEKHHAFLCLIHPTTEQQPAPASVLLPLIGQAPCMYACVLICLCVSRRQRTPFQDGDASQLRVHIFTYTETNPENGTSVSTLQAVWVSRGHSDE